MITRTGERLIESYILIDAKEVIMSRGPKSIGLTIVAVFFSVHIAVAADAFSSVLVGTKGGLSFRAGVGVSNFAVGFPLGMQFGLTYSSVEPGDPFPARRVFIANADNGTPETAGHTWDLRMDFLYDLKIRGPKAIYVYAGPRLSFFDGTFRFVGANEEFDVTSTQWGLGLGLEGLFALSSKVDLTIAAGFDGYLNGPIHGHDTTYNPDDINVNPRENFTYKDAKEVIYTPRFQPTAMIGMSYVF
jgi:hypothetical protein